MRKTADQLFAVPRVTKFTLKKNKSSYAPINVKPPGGEAGLGVGVRHFFIFFCQMPHPRAAECGQMQLKIPNLGTNLMVKCPQLAMKSEIITQNKCI